MNKIRNIGPYLKAVDSLLYLTVTFDGCCSSSDSLPHPMHWLTQPHNSLFLWDLVPHILWSLESQSIVLFFNRDWWGFVDMTVQFHILKSVVEVRKLFWCTSQYSRIFKAYFCAFYVQVVKLYSFCNFVKCFSRIFYKVLSKMNSKYFDLSQGHYQSC